VLLKLKYPYQISKVVNTSLIVLEVLVSHTVEIGITVTVDLTLKALSAIAISLLIAKGLYSGTFRKSSLEAISFKWTSH